MNRIEHYLSGIADVYTEAEIKELGISENEGLGKVNKKSVYEIINDLLINSIESGTIPWRKTWDSKASIGDGTAFMNFRSKKNYTGVNPWLISAFLKPHHCNYFLTKAQIEGRGGKIKKDATVFRIVYLGRAIKTLIVDPTPEKPDGDVLTRAIRFLKEYRIYNLADTEGIDWKKNLPNKPKTEKERLENCELVYKMYPNKPTLSHGGDSAHYVPSKDHVQMPVYESFKKPQEYYTTLFHELIHSTGSPKRLKRDFSGRFGNAKYAYEELIAEIGATYICGHTGILFTTKNNSAAYLKGWMKALTTEAKENKTFFFKAASDAQKASNYILSKQLEKQKNKKKSKALSGLGKAAPTNLKNLNPETLQDYIALALYGIRIKTDSFKRYSDRNYLEGKTGKSIQLHYLAKDGKSLDQVVGSFLDNNPQFWHLDSSQVIEDFIQFMLDYPNGPAGYATGKKQSNENKWINELEYEAEMLRNSLAKLKFKRVSKSKAKSK